jgi:hypothetical protein
MTFSRNGEYVTGKSESCSFLNFLSIPLMSASGTDTDLVGAEQERI